MFCFVCVCSLTTIVFLCVLVASSASASDIMRKVSDVIKRAFIFGSETRNVTGDRHSQVPLEHRDVFIGYLKKELHGWIEHHASDSEAIVKAENHAIEQTIAQLQSATTAFFTPVTTTPVSFPPCVTHTAILEHVQTTLPSPYGTGLQKTP